MDDSFTQSPFPFDKGESNKGAAGRTVRRRTTAGRAAVCRKRDVTDPAQARLAFGAVIDEKARLRLERRVSAHLSGELNLAVTDNRYSIISVRRSEGRYHARVHHMFLESEPRTVRALARYIWRNDPRSSMLLNDFIERNQDKIRRSPVKPSPKPVIETRGQVWDLMEIFEDLNRRYFQGSIDARITWGRKSKRSARRHRSIKMGSYSVEDQLIRIHPALDRPFVPRYFIESVVHHEMLHYVHPIPVIAGRRQFHTPEFLAQEKTFPHYHAAKKWERANINRLLYY